MTARFAFGGILILIFLYLFCLNCLQGLQAPDDYLYAFKWEAATKDMDERVSSFTDLIYSQVNHYKYQNPRVLSHAIIQILLCLPWWVFALMNSLVLMILSKQIVDLALIREPTPLKENYIWYLLGFMLLFLFYLDWGFSYTVLNGTVNYTWTLIPVLFFIKMIEQLYYNEKYNLFVIGTVSILVGLCNEHITLTFFLGSLLLIGFTKDKKINLIVASLGLLVAGCILFFAPSRFGHIEGGYGLLYQLAYFLKHFSIIHLSYLPLYFLIFIFSLKSKLGIRNWWFIGMAILSNLVMVISPIYQSRAGVFGSVLLVMVVINLWFLNKSKIRFNYIIGTLCLLCVGLGIHRFSLLYQYSQYASVDINKLKTNDSRNNDVYVDGIPMENSRDLYVYNFQHYPIHFANQSAARYYGKSKITLSNRYFVSPEFQVNTSTNMSNSYLKEDEQFLLIEKENYTIIAKEIFDDCNEETYFLLRPLPIWFSYFFFIPDRFKIHFLKKYDLIYCDNSNSNSKYMFSQLPAGYKDKVFLYSRMDKNNFKVESVKRIKLSLEN